MLGTPARLTTARLITRVSQLSRAYSLRYTAASTPMGAEMHREMVTRYSVPRKADQIPPRRIPPTGLVVRKSQDSSGQARITR